MKPDKQAIVEQVARALYEHWVAEQIVECAPWKRLGDKESWRERAQAAITAHESVLVEENERLNELALSGVNMGIATGLQMAANWHRERYRDTPDAFEMEFHEVSERTILTMLHGSEKAARAALEQESNVQPSGIDPRYEAPASITSTHSDACLEDPTSDPNCPRCADLRTYRAALEQGK